MTWVSGTVPSPAIQDLKSHYVNKPVAPFSNTLPVAACETLALSPGIVLHKISHI